MDNTNTSTTKAPSVRIGIRGLTHTKSMLGGGIYLLIAETTSARFPMLAGSVAGAFEDGLSCTLIVPGNTPQFIQRIERLSLVNTTEMIEAGRLQIFMTQDNFLKKMFQFGADRFVGELEDFGIPENSYLIFDQADELLSLHDISLAQEQVNVLKDWFYKKGITALLVFSRFTDAHNNTVNAIMDSLGGIVRLGAAREGLELKFDYWQSPTSVIAAKTYNLETLDTGLYKASTKAPVADAFMDEEILESKATDRQMLGYEGRTQLGTQQVATQPELYRGYLTPLNFMKYINGVLEQFNKLNTNFSLVVGIPSKGIVTGDIIRRFDRSSRLGELITADDRQCYIFLNIEEKSIVLDNLEMILGFPVVAVFSQYRFLSGLDEIRLEMEALSYVVQLRSFPDFSAIHEMSLPLRNVLDQPAETDHFMVNEQQRFSTESQLNAVSKYPVNSGSSVVLDFQSAKRSASLSPAFVKKKELIDGSHEGASSELTDEFVFDIDIDLESPVFNKDEAPRAKRSLN